MDYNVDDDNNTNDNNKCYSWSVLTLINVADQEFCMNCTFAVTLILHRCYCSFQTNSCPLCRHELPTDDPKYEEMKNLEVRKINEY